MKRILFLLVVLTNVFLGFAQEDVDMENETVRPSYNKEVVRICLTCDIEGKEYSHVTVVMKSKLKDPYCLHRDRVKVVIKDAHGKKLYKKVLDAHLYVYSNGQVQVGKPTFDQIVVFPRSYGQWHCVVRETDGV